MNNWNPSAALECQFINRTAVSATKSSASKNGIGSKHRRRCICLIVALFLGIMLDSQRSEAQYTANFQTNIISGVTSNWTGDYVIGSNTLADVLLIQSSGILSNRYGYLGYEVNSSSNSVLVTGTGSVWSNSKFLTVGNSGAGNSLVISNGGRVANDVYDDDCSCFGSGYVGYNSGSSKNRVLVTGSGSVWSIGDEFDIGYSGAGNTLVISNGGRVVNNGTSFIGYNSSSSNNSVLVVGIDSVWSNGYFTGLLIGGSGAANSLVISNGGQVIDGAESGSIIGYNPSSSNNSVLVTGSGSVWSNGLYGLSVGYSGAGNTLVIEQWRSRD